MGAPFDIEKHKAHMLRMKNDPEYATLHRAEDERKERDSWNEIKPFLNEAEVPHLPRMTAFLIQRLIELGAIPKANLEDGVWYYGNYRNSTLGKWNETTKKFDHYRYKFGIQKDECNHFEDDDGYALFVPLRKANEEELNQIRETEESYLKEKTQ